MDKYAYRRAKLKALIRERYKGVAASLANAVDIAPSSISRMLYPDDKAGRKRIGEDTIEKIEKIHPGWFRDGYIGQLEYFMKGMSDEHKDMLLEYANHLYNKDNPDDKLSNPYPSKKAKTVDLGDAEPNPNIKRRANA